MKKTTLRLAALALSAALLLSGGALAIDPAIENPALRDDPNYIGTTIDIETKFDFIMQNVDWFSISAEGKDVLRQYFNQYFEQHPEEFTALVNDIMQSMDAHSRYMSAAQYAETFGQTLSDYVGIGVTMQEQTGPVLVDVYEGGPAYKAGLRVGDTIVKIDGVSVSGKSNTDLVALLRGEEGGVVEVTVMRDGAEQSFSVIRTRVTPEHVSAKTLAKGVEYIRVAAMGSEVDSDKFVRLWNALPAKDTRAVILDLRGNGGGLLSMAQTMIETIVPSEGTKYLGLRERKSLGGLEEFYTPGGGFRLNELIILVDGDSASAAEIVAGALSDLGEATLLGTKTYGKGVGQMHLAQPDGSMLIITSMEVHLPKRGVYNGEGLVPDIQLALDRTTSGGRAALSPLDTQTLCKPGDRGASVRAMTERLRILGYLDSAQEGYDAAVLEAVRRFRLSLGKKPGIFADADTLKALDSQAQRLHSASEGLDNQLAAALAICELAAEKPAQYTKNADGTWTNSN